MDLKTLEVAVRTAFGADYELGSPLGKDDSINPSFSVTNSKSRQRYVLHVLPSDGLLFQNTSREIPHVVDQVTARVPVSADGTFGVLALRPRMDAILADVDIDSFLDTSESSSLGVRLSILEQILEGLRSIHKQNLFHGDIRWENVAITKSGSSQLVDPFFRRRPADWTRDTKDWFTFEGRLERQSQSTDVLAFGRLALRVLGNFLWDSRDLPSAAGSLRSGAFEWVLDFCTTVPASMRPSAETLLDVLFGSGRMTRRLAYRRLDDAREYCRAHFTNRDSATAALTRSLIPYCSWQIGLMIERHPETAIALLPAGAAESLMRRMIVDIAELRTHNGVNVSRNKADDKGKFANVALIEVAELPSDIDDVWKDRLHRHMFGSEFDSQHDRRMQDLEARGTRLPRREEFLARVAVMNSVRRDLLEQTTYLHSADVARLMSEPDDAVSVAEVTVLRRWGVLLSVPDHGRWLYPGFQFDDYGTPRTEIYDVNMRFPSQENPWATLSWWLAERPSLRGKSLASLVGTRKFSDAVFAAIELLAA